MYKASHHPWDVTSVSRSDISTHHTRSLVLKLNPENTGLSPPWSSRDQKVPALQLVTGSLTGLNLLLRHHYGRFDEGPRPSLRWYFGQTD